MATKSGKITALGSRGGVAKASGKPFTINTVLLEDGTEIEVGFKQPYSVGEYFSRRVEVKFGKLADVGAAVPGDVEMAATSPAPAARSAGSAPSGGGYQARVFPVGRESGEISIIRQNALTNARELVLGMVAGTGLPLAKADRQQALDAIVEDVLYVAYKFADFSSGQREVNEAQKLARSNPPGV